jgi:hypothetical protein
VSEKAKWKGYPTSHFLIEHGAGCRKGHVFEHSLMVSSTDYVLVCKKAYTETVEGLYSKRPI